MFEWLIRWILATIEALSEIIFCFFRFVSTNTNQERLLHDKSNFSSPRYDDLNDIVLKTKPTLLQLLLLRFFFERYSLSRRSYEGTPRSKEKNSEMISQHHPLLMGHSHRVSSPMMRFHSHRHHDANQKNNNNDNSDKNNNNNELMQGRRWSLPSNEKQEQRIYKIANHLFPDRFENSKNQYQSHNGNENINHYTFNDFNNNNNNNIHEHLTKNHNISDLWRERIRLMVYTIQNFLIHQTQQQQQQPIGEHFTKRSPSKFKRFTHKPQPRWIQFLKLYWRVAQQKLLQNPTSYYTKILLPYLPVISVTGMALSDMKDPSSSILRKLLGTYLSSISNVLKHTKGNIGLLNNHDLKISIPQISVHHLSMIEILIAISIIVTFSGLTGAVLAQVYEESRVSNALLDLAKLQEGLVLYYTRHGKYPLALEDLLEGGELNKVPKDPWGTDYLYVPHLDWNRLNRILLTTSSGGSGAGSSSSISQQLSYYNEVLKRMETVLLTLPGGVTPMSLLAISNDQPFCICVGTKIPRFPSKIDVDVSRERIRYTASLMKMAMERSSVASSVSQQGSSSQQQTSVMNQIAELNARIKNILNIARSSAGSGGAE